MRLTVGELERSLENITQSVLSFDVQSYIQERITESTDPMMASIKKFLGNLQDLKRDYEETKKDQKETNMQLVSEVNKRVQVEDYRARWANHDKVYQAD